MKNRMESRKYPLVSVTKLADGTIAESHALWNYGWRPKADGTGPDVLFDPSSVRDTLKGRFCGLLNRIKRRLSLNGRARARQTLH